MLLSVSEIYLIPKVKTSLRVLKIQYPKDRFESPMDRIRISILESEKNWKGREGFESFCRKFESLLNKNSNLHSDKKEHFCPCFGYFMAWYISDKNEDKVQNLLSYLYSDHFGLIYYVKNRSK